MKTLDEPPLDKESPDAPLDTRALGEVARRLASARDLGEVLGRIAELARRAGAADAAHLEQADAEGTHVVVVAAAGELAPRVGSRAPFPGSLAADALERDAPEILSPEQLMRRPVAGVLEDACRGCSALVAPLISEGLPLGALILFRTPQRPRFTPSEAERLRVLADLAALALRRALAEEQANRGMAELREREEELRRLSERYRALYEENPTMYFTTDERGIITSVNHFGAAHLGYHVEELLQRPVAELIVPEDRPAFERIHADALSRPGSVLRAEVRKQRKDGRRIWVREVVRAVATPGGTAVLNVCEDITDRVKVEQELHFLAEAGRTLAGSLEWERTLQTVAELAVPVLADWCAIDLLEDDELRRLVVTHADPGMGEAARSYQERYPPALDALHGSGRVVRTGQMELIPTITEDMLREVARDEEHLRALERLGLRSLIVVPLVAGERTLGTLTLVSAESGRTFGPEDVRTAELLGSRAALALDKARLFREAREATQARDEVLSIVSHDLRNPLNTIVMSTDLLLDLGTEGRPDGGRAQLEIIRRQAQQMNRMIQDLLDVARLEAGRLPLEEQREDPASLVADACASARPLAEGKGILLECDVPAGLPRVCADSERILQVFSNLLGNAIRFTPEGGVIHVGAAAADGEVRFEVADSGPGIDPEDAPHLFERFYQARKTQRGGAGLGLSIAKGIVEAHGGRIGVDSAPGEGSTFYFTLPVERGG